jgi:hypothetical protein
MQNGKITIAACVALVVLTGCAHIASTNGTFIRNNGIVLTLTRHVDTIVRGPDIDEDQRLVLVVPTLEIGRKMMIPSEDVQPSFSVSRFGPSSTGKGFKGYLILKSVADEQVVAHLHLDVQAQTADGSYRQKARFSGNYVFDRSATHD